MCSCRPPCGAWSAAAHLATCHSLIGHHGCSWRPIWGRHVSSWNQTKIFFGCYLREKAAAWRGWSGRFEECFWEGCGVVERESWKRKVAVAAELVGGANPGEKKSCYRGEKEEEIQERKRRNEKRRLVGEEIFWGVFWSFWGGELLFGFFGVEEAEKRLLVANCVEESLRVKPERGSREVWRLQREIRSIWSWTGAYHRRILRYGCQRCIVCFGFLSLLPVFYWYLNVGWFAWGG